MKSTPSAPGSRAAQPTTAAWDDSWTTRLAARHKAVFDSPEVQDGTVLAHAVGYINAMRSIHNAHDDDVRAVIVLRHSAIPMVFNDAIWEKYGLGGELKIKGSGSEEWVTTNPYLKEPAGASGQMDQPREALSWLASHGHILLACDRATRAVAGRYARKAKVESRVVYDELVANLVPGVILQPTGVYAALRAQEIGCSYIRST